MGATQRVTFEGGPLAGRTRDIPASRTDWRPVGLSVKGVYMPASPGSARWTWKVER